MLANSKLIHTPCASGSARYEFAYALADFKRVLDIIILLNINSMYTNKKKQFTKQIILGLN